MMHHPNRVPARPALRLLLIIVCCVAGYCCCDETDAMVYRPSQGRFKDGFLFRHDGQFYLFSMCSLSGTDDFRHVWLAKSADGVHWSDVGPVIKDAPFNIWAMSVHQVGDKFILNHGSFSRPGVQNVIRFWESSDLVQWKYLGPASDLYPDTRWFHPDSRLDCMSVVPVQENNRTHYYGYATGPGGFLESTDGLRWTGLPQPQVEWDTVKPPPTPADEGGFEVGGCHAMRDKYYLVGGWFNYQGSTGYGVYTLIGDTPRGPFRADAPAYRLCGNSGRWVALWARFCPTESEVLVNGYMYDGYTYETGNTWLPPIKKAQVDANGHLRLAYWDGNEALKGQPVAVNFTSCKQAFPDPADPACKVSATEHQVRIEAQPERNSIMRVAPPTTIALCDAPLDFENGVVIEGTLQATCHDRRLVASSIGFFLEEEPRVGTAIRLHSYGKTEIGRLTLGQGATFECEDEIGPGCAAPAGITPHEDHTFRLLVRKNMFELYLDDMYVQTFNTTHQPDVPGRTPQRLGLIAENGIGQFDNLRIWAMNLAP